MGGTKVFLGLLFFALTVYITEGQRQRKCKVTAVDVRGGERKCFRRSEWKIEEDNDQYKIVCRCRGFYIRECVKCNYERTTTTTTTGLPETTTDSPVTTTELPATTTSLPETTSGVPETTPGVPETTPGVPETTPGVPETTSGVPETTPGVPVTTPGLPETTPGVPVTTPGLPEPPIPEITTEATG